MDLKVNDMKKNEIVARFMGYNNPVDDLPLTAWNYSNDYQCLMPAWVKFRDLKFDLNDVKTRQYHALYIQSISYKITHCTITEAFDELVKGIEWYNYLKK